MNYITFSWIYLKDDWQFYVICVSVYWQKIPRSVYIFMKHVRKCEEQPSSYQLLHMSKMFIMFISKIREHCATLLTSAAVLTPQTKPMLWIQGCSPFFFFFLFFKSSTLVLKQPLRSPPSFLPLPPCLSSVFILFFFCFVTAPLCGDWLMLLLGQSQRTDHWILFTSLCTLKKICNP